MTSFLKRPKKRWTVKVGFDLRDMWIGVYWKEGYEDMDTMIGRAWAVTVWVCLLPCCYVRIRRWS